MTLIVGSLQLGLIYGLLAVGVYIAFRILDIPDLSAEGTFTFGLAVSAALTAAGHPLAGVLLDFWPAVWAAQSPVFCRLNCVSIRF